MSYFLLGLGVGAAVGMLLAPKSGIETRNYLQAKGGETADMLKRQGQDLGHSAVETIERGKQTVQSKIKGLSDAVDAGKQAFRETVEQAGAAVKA